MTITTGENVNAVTAMTWAAASVCSQIYSLVNTGRVDVARCLFNGLTDELRREVHRVMDADLPKRVLAAIDAGLLDPDAVFVDETTTPARIVVVERAEPQDTPRQKEPMWDQLVEAALVEVLRDRDLVSTITANRESYRNLVRRVRERVEDEGIEVADVLRRLGEVKLDAVTQVSEPVVYLTAKVRDWTPDTDSNSW